MKTITVNVSEPVYEDFREYARKQDRKASELIREAMEAYRRQHMLRRTSLRDGHPASVGGPHQNRLDGNRRYSGGNARVTHGIDTRSCLWPGYAFKGRQFRRRAATATGSEGCGPRHATAYPQFFGPQAMPQPLSMVGSHSDAPMVDTRQTSGMPFPDGEAVTDFSDGYRATGSAAKGCSTHYWRRHTSGRA